MQPNRAGACGAGPIRVPGHDRLERRKANSDMPAMVTDLKTRFESHCRRFSHTFVQDLHASIPPDDFAELEAKLESSERVVVSHPHPHLLSLGPISRFTTRLAATYDRLRDKTVNNRTLAGAADIVRELHRAGLVVVLATSAPNDELRLLRSALDADDAIDGQTSADDVERSKPDPEVFATAIRRFSIDARRALAVGDSIWDVQAARAAGIGCLTVESGGFSQHELSEAGALHVYRDVNEILHQLWTSPLAQLPE